MKRHRTVHKKIKSSGKTSRRSPGDGRHEDDFEEKAVKAPHFVYTDPVTGRSYYETEVCEAFRDAIRGSVYELYAKRGWEPENG